MERERRTSPRSSHRFLRSDRVATSPTNNPTPIGINPAKHCNMDYRTLGASKLQVSAVGLGCNNFGIRCDLGETRAVVHKALDLGITLFDTADSYGRRGGSETLLGQILGPRRKEVVLATKFGTAMDDTDALKGASRRYIMMAVEASLRRLQTDWIDLYQLHHPDPATPIEETLRALDDLVRQGKVRQIGSSNFSGRQVAEAHEVARCAGLHPFVSAQNEYSLLRRAVERDAAPVMVACGVGLLPYFPLASGLLTGKYRREDIPPGTRLATPRPHESAVLAAANWKLIDALDGYSQGRGRSLLELAISWLLAKPLVASVIAGATKPEQLEKNASAARWSLTDDEVADIDRLCALYEAPT
jgi:aryl-alcohol dehydrogenase-like predicted oxidoreductase